MPRSPHAILPSHLASGNQRTFTGESLRAIAFPLGGIGTGTVSLGGRGQLHDWEVFNRPAKGRDLPFTCFALWAQADGQKPLVRILEREPLPPYTSSHGFARERMAGLPHLQECRFTGAYPFAWLEFDDDRLPLQLGLEAFNPFVPLDDGASGLPVAIFLWHLHNPGAVPVRATLLLNIANPIGFDGQTWRNEDFGGNVNELRREAGATGFFLKGSDRIAPDDVRFGTMAVVTPHRNITYQAHWLRGGWFDELQRFWDDFAADGELQPIAPDPSPDGRTDCASLGLRLTVQPHETVRLPVILAWHFPNLVNYWNREEEVRGQWCGNWYCTQYDDAWQAARYTLDHLDELESATRKWQRAFLDSTLPPEVLDAASSQVSTIRTTTCLRTADGNFHGFEGSSDNAGCCPMDCTHVWNYEQALAYLFPQLERTMRDSDFLCATRDDGRMGFRLLIPAYKPHEFKPAADGQMGCLLKLYREWQLSGGTEWLRRLWPKARLALEFAWQHWDPDADGVMTGEQHNTYDIEFWGPNPMMGALYLGALRAGAAMAEALGDAQCAEKYRDILSSGSRKLDELCWEQDFYVQRLPPPEQIATDGIAGMGEASRPAEGTEGPKYQFGLGCLSDQLLGQWFCHVVGLGYVLPEPRVQQALLSVFRHNFRRSLREHANCQRVYALNDEGGLLLCSWPHGERPALPFPYSDEVWTGIEYQVAAHLIYEGFVQEGLEIVRAVRDRSAGLNRNPWDEPECGRHYARAMSSWSLVLALSGYRYSAVEQRLAFAPKVQPDDFRCFFSTGGGWGVFSQRADETGFRAQVHLDYGELTLRTIDLATQATEATVMLEDTPLGATVGSSAAGIRLDFAEPITLRAGETLAIKA